jgi:hypothetical protein
LKVKNNGNGNGFPAEAGSYGDASVPLTARAAFRGTGFSREEASGCAINFDCLNLSDRSTRSAWECILWRSAPALSLF